MVTDEESGPEIHNPTFRCLAHEQRRAALEGLLTWGSPQTERLLAAYIGAYDRGTPSISERDVSLIRKGLVHGHLPTLEASRLILWDRDNQVIQLTDHPAITDQRFQQLLSVEAEGLDAVFDGLAHEYRRIVLTALRDSRLAMSPEALASKIRHRDNDENGLSSNGVDTVQIALHHNHLPRLADSGLVEYHPETDQVRYAAHPALEEVFTIIYNPGEALSEKAVGFFDELQETIDQSKPDSSTEIEWPHSWRRPYNG